MLLECRNCGAPLDVKHQARVVKCTYCGFSSQIGELRTLQPQTPPAWRPPPHWIPPAHVPAPSVQLRYHRPPNFAPFIIAATMVPLIGSGVAAFAFTSASTSKSFVMPGATAEPDPGKSWNGTSTLECPMNGKIRIENRTAKVDGVAIRLNMNCEATLVGVNVAGRTAVEMSSNAKLFVEGGSIEGDDLAIDVGTNGRVELRKNARIKSNRIGVQLGINGRLSMENGQLDARDAVKLGINPHVRLVRTKVTGKDSGLIGGTNAEIELDGSSLVAPQGIVTHSNARVNVRENSSIEAEDAAISVDGVSTVVVERSRIKGKPSLEADRLATIRLRNATIIGPRKLPKGLKIDER